MTSTATLDELETGREQLLAHIAALRDLRQGQLPLRLRRRPPPRVTVVPDLHRRRQDPHSLNRRIRAGETRAQIAECRRLSALVAVSTNLCQARPRSAAAKQRRTGVTESLYDRIRTGPLRPLRPGSECRCGSTG